MPARMDYIEGMKPRVIIHNAVSLDGRVDRFAVDLGLYYGIASRFEEDATLVGSETCLRSPLGAALQAEPAADHQKPASGAPEDAPLLVVPDSRGRIRDWNPIRKEPYWRDILVLVSAETPPDHIERLQRQGVSYFVSGREKVDLAASLESLNQRTGAKTVRVDSGVTLNGVLLRAGLVDEVSLLLHPSLVGGTSPGTLFRDPDGSPDSEVIALALVHLERLDGDVVWARYEVVIRGHIT